RRPFGRERVDVLLVEQPRDVVDEGVEMAVLVVVEVVQLEDLDLRVRALPYENDVDDPDEPQVDERFDLRGGDTREPVTGVLEDEQLDGADAHGRPPRRV